MNCTYVVSVLPYTVGCSEIYSVDCIVVEVMVVLVEVVTGEETDIGVGVLVML